MKSRRSPRASSFSTKASSTLRFSAAFRSSLLTTRLYVGSLWFNCLVSSFCARIVSTLLLKVFTNFWLDLLCLCFSSSALFYFSFFELSTCCLPIYCLSSWIWSKRRIKLSLKYFSMLVATTSMLWLALSTLQ